MGKIMTEANNVVLPKGITQEVFSEAIQKLVNLLGAENVLTKEEYIVPYKKVMMSVDAAEHSYKQNYWQLLASTMRQVYKLLQ